MKTVKIKTNALSLTDREVTNLRELLVFVEEQKKSLHIFFEEDPSTTAEMLEFTDELKKCLDKL